MPVQPTYPGVYIEEIPSGVRTITGVATSITAFLGPTLRGPVNQAVRIFSLRDYERYFGGLSADSPLSYAVSQFFLNGGSDAYVVRLAKNPKPASLILKDDAGNPVLAVQAVDEGTSGNDIQVLVDYNTIGQGTFNITFAYVSQDNPADIRVETFKNVSLDPQSPRYIDDAVNNVSQLVTVTENPSVLNPPASSSSGSGAGGSGGGASGSGTKGSGASGSGSSSGGSGSTALATTGPKLPALLGPAGGSLTSATFGANDLKTLPSSSSNSFMISLDGETTPSLVTIDSSKTAAGSDLSTQLPDVAARIQQAVRSLKPALPAYRGFTCTADVTNKQLVLASGTTDANSSVAVTAATSNDIAQALHLLNGTTKAGGTPALQGGTGAPFTQDDPDAYSIFSGDPIKREGIYAFESVDLFNLLCLPGITNSGILTAALQYCQQRRAFLIIDAPLDAASATPKSKAPADMVKFINDPNLPKADLGTYAALYYPWVQLPDPLKGGKLELFPPCGIIAGLYARTDTTRGVWKAPAGTDANLVGVQGIDYLLTDAENGELNPHGVNCLRVFSVYGAVCWGARTVSGDDQIASDYKYVPIRRLALYIEESLYRGTKWVVFEPNDEPLWAQIRLNIGAFMHNLFRQGAFQGQTPKDAYFVKCDKETTTQNDIDLGIVNIVVGFAPLKPAEFVIIQLQQIAGQLQV